MSKNLFLGVDIGSYSVRAGLFDEVGRQISFGSKEYVVDNPHPGWFELHPNDVWNAFVESIQICLINQEKNRSSINSISISGTAVSLVVCDEHNEPIIPIILWMDTRSFKEAEYVSTQKSEWLRYTGEFVSPEWFLPKVLWLKENNPEVYNRARMFSETTDWIEFKLTDRWTASLTTASAEWTYNKRLGGWPFELFEKIELNQLSQSTPSDFLPPGEIIGLITPSVADEIGLSKEVVVSKGLMDSYAAALGLNIFNPGRVILSLGTSSAYLTVVKQPVFHTGLLGPVPDSFGDGIWALQGGQTSAGAVINWYKNNLSEDSSYDELDEKASKIEPGSKGLLALDCWQGSRSPFRDPMAKGALWGLRVDHTKIHIYRSLLESVAFGGRQIIEIMKSIGVEINELWVCGGGTKSSLWMKIHADVIGIPLYVADIPNTALVGSAICAAVGSGCFSNLAEASKNMSVGGTCIPANIVKHKQYNPYYQEYVQGYPALKDSFKRLHCLNS